MGCIASALRNHPRVSLLAGEERTAYSHALIMFTEVLDTSLHDVIISRQPSQEERIRLVRGLLDSGYPVSLADEYGCTPLQLACDRGHAEVVRMLLERGAKVVHSVEEHGEVWEEGWTVLHCASRSGSLEAVRHLLAVPAGRALVNQPSKVGETPVQ